MQGEGRMAKLVAHMRLIAGALALAFIVAMTAPVSAQQPNLVNPNADAVKEQQLLQQLKTIEGRGTIPDVRSYVLEHPVGRNWQEFHNVTLRWIVGMLLRCLMDRVPLYSLPPIKLKDARSTSLPKAGPCHYLPR